MRSSEPIPSLPSFQSLLASVSHWINPVESLNRKGPVSLTWDVNEEDINIKKEKKRIKFNPRGPPTSGSNRDLESGIINSTRHHQSCHGYYQLSILCFCPLVLKLLYSSSLTHTDTKQGLAPTTPSQLSQSAKGTWGLQLSVVDVV